MKKLSMIAAAAAVLFVAPVASAQVYLGGAIGASQLDVDCADADRCDDTDTGFRIFGGYKLGNGWAVEANYFNFGEASAAGPTVFGYTTATFKGTSIGLGVAYAADLAADVTGTFRIGIASNKTKVGVTVAGASGSDDESKTAPYFGLGLGYRLNKQLSVEAGLDFTRFEYEGEKADARLISVGLKYEF